MSSITLKLGREKSLLRRHPWVFSGAVAKVEGDPQPGETVVVCASDGAPLALGAYSPHSQIAVRIWSFDPAESVTPAFFRERLRLALDSRHPSLVMIWPRSRPNHHSSLTAYRLVNAESDGLPGVIVDRYAEFLVCQFLTAGAEYWKREIVTLLADLLPFAGIYERSDVDVRAKEGLAPTTGVLAGSPPPDLVEIEEYACRFAVDVRRGHKTGFYLDQRENRALVAEFSEGREVLNCFAYSGGFGVWALKGGAAHVTNLDSSSAALELAQRNVELNGLNPAQVEHVVGDAFQVLRQYRDARRQFDLVILDPPKFAESRSQVERAARGYKDINLLAFKLLRPGGLLFTFSCSGLIEPELFQSVVAGAALDAGREAQIIQRLAQAPDHPVALNFPEGAYLKGLVCRAT
ncbi:MAG: class I SAM-dependent rRNA methyltransferase [Anaerolineales bacterium]